MQKVYNWDHSPEVDDVECLAMAANKHLYLLKQKDEAKSSFIIEKIVGKLLRTQNTRPFPLYLPPNGWKFYLHSDPEETKCTLSANIRGKSFLIHPL